MSSMPTETKISFNVKCQKQQVINTNFLNCKSADGDDHETSEHKHRIKGNDIIGLENGKIVCNGIIDIAKDLENDYIIPLRKTTHDWRFQRLKKIVEGVDFSQTNVNHKNLEEKDAFHQTTIDSSLDPSASDETIDPDYSEIPVDKFGIAFLRGCGWTAKGGIGKTNLKIIPLRINEQRPKGLGLGATITSTNKKKNDGKKNEKDQKSNHNEEYDQEELKPLGKKSFVKCLGGLHKGAYGEVASMDMENSSVFVRLSLPLRNSGKVIRVSQFAIDVVSSKEYKRKLAESSESKDCHRISQ